MVTEFPIRSTSVPTTPRTPTATRMRTDAPIPIATTAARRSPIGRSAFTLGNQRLPNGPARCSITSPPSCDIARRSFASKSGGRRRARQPYTIIYSRTESPPPSWSPPRRLDHSCSSASSNRLACPAAKSSVVVSLPLNGGFERYEITRYTRERVPPTKTVSDSIAFHVECSRDGSLRPVIGLAVRCQNRSAGQAEAR